MKLNQTAEAYLQFFDRVKEVRVPRINAINNPQPRPTRKVLNVKTGKVETIYTQPLKG